MFYDNIYKICNDKDSYHEGTRRQYGELFTIANNKADRKTAKYDVGKTERGANADGDTFTRRMICQKLLS